ncbi:MAG: hypothetical protein R2699_15750 [Acidimicrobiales bacterium]
MTAHDDDGDDHSSSQTTYLNSRDLERHRRSCWRRARTSDHRRSAARLHDPLRERSGRARHRRSEVVVSTVLDPDVDLDSVEAG